jgi:serine/threonine-protein kinase
MTAQTENFAASNDDKTIVGRPCPRCRAINAKERLPQQGYTCQHCGFELAYLDYTATGGVRQVLGWVRNVGDIINERYQVQEILGRGGFGSTYLVSDLRLNGKRRALKEIPPNMFDDQEPMLLSKLDHPGIPDITDRFENEGLICLVLEFGGTDTMESKRKEFDGKIPLALLLPWLCQLCDVLDYLHSRQPQIIHRDLKPGNILLDENNRIRLIDFGIAKIAHPSEATHTLGRAISQGFSSPEQIAGAGTDHRSDIFGLGATIYFLISGVHPPSLTERIGNETLKPLTDLAPGIPPELDLAVAQALDLNPNKRQQSIKEFWDVFIALTPQSQRSIAPSLKHTKKQTEKQTKGENHTLKIILGLILLAVSIAAGAYYFWRQEMTEKQAMITVPERQVAPPKSLIAQPEEPAEKIVLPPTSQSIKPVTPKTSTPEDLPARTTEVAPPTEKTTTAAPKTEAPIIPKEKVQPSSISSQKEKKKLVQRTATVPKKLPTPQSNKTPPQAPEKAPVQEEKPATDWSGSMQWGESRPKSP